MGTKRPKPEDVVAKLRQAEVLISQGQSGAEAIRALGVREVTDSRWREEFGGLKSAQVRRMTEMEVENQRLRRLEADLSLEKQVLADVAAGTCSSRTTPAGSHRHPREGRGARRPRERDSGSIAIVAVEGAGGFLPKARWFWPAELSGFITIGRRPHALGIRPGPECLGAAYVDAGDDVHTQRSISFWNV